MCRPLVVSATALPLFPNQISRIESCLEAGLAVPIPGIWPDLDAPLWTLPTLPSRTARATPTWHEVKGFDLVGGHHCAVDNLKDWLTVRRRRISLKPRAS